LQLPILHPYGSLAAVFANNGAVLESLKVGYACALRRIAKGANARVVECRVQNYRNVWKSPPLPYLLLDDKKAVTSRKLPCERLH